MFGWLVVACAGPGDDDTEVVVDTDVVDTDADTDTEDPGYDATSSGCAEGGPWPEEVLDDGSVRVRTEHYVLTVDAQADAQDYARLTEAAYAAWADDFGAEPYGAPFELVMYPSEQAWVDGLAARGVTAPRGAGGYYDPGTRLASMWRQPTLYFTEMLWLHEAFHQFHLQTRTGGVLPVWYVEGMAEWTSRHDWDGRCVRVAAEPRATWEDYWAHADLDRLADHVAADDFPGRPSMMGFVHFLATEHPDDFAAFRADIDFGLGASFDATGLDDAYAAHVDRWQEPMTPLWLDWLHRSPTTMRGVSAGALSVVRYKEPPAQVIVEIPVVPGAYAGGLVGWAEDGFDVVFVDGTGSVSRWTSTPTRNDWVTIGAIPQPGPRIRWTQKGGEVWLDGRAVVLDPVLPAAAGHAIYGASADFVLAPRP